MYTIKKIISNFSLFIIFFLSGQAASQYKQTKEIDELLKKADISNKKYEDLKELEYGKKANIIALQSGDSERIAKSYFFIARSLLNLGLQKESFIYIKKAEEQDFAKKDITIKALLAEVKGSNYEILKLPAQYFKEELETIDLLKDKTDYVSLEIKSRCYANLANHNLYYKKNSNADSTFIYLDLQKRQLEKLPEKKFFPAICEYYSFKGCAFLLNKKSDSAFYYLKKAYQLKQKYKDPVLYVQYLYFGDYYNQQKQYQNALNFYLKAVKNLRSYSARKDFLLDIYKNISDIYGILGEKDKHFMYAGLYSQIKKELLIKRNNDLDYALNVILNDKNLEYQQDERKKYLWIISGISLLIIIFLIIYYFLQKKLKDKQIVITEVSNTLQQKEELISKKYVETELLQQKVNNVYNEVVELAKNNDPSFYFRFQEVYPEFQKKLLMINPSLRTSELILCAYTFLGFTIKDIADYTFKSMNTIRNRKQSLRKKFNIPSEQDIGVWLRNLIETKGENKIN